jgi:preprotein translocase subunit SecG
MLAILYPRFRSTLAARALGCYNGPPIRESPYVKEARLETGLYIATIIVSFALIGLVIIQGRNAGLQARDSSSIYRTKRGLEKTIYQATIVLSVVFLLLSLITSLPLFGSAAPVTPVTVPQGLIGLPGLF